MTTRFGIVLPSWIYSDARRALADEAFRTLNHTHTDLFKVKPMLMIVSKGQWPLDLSGVKGFNWEVIRVDGLAQGTEQSLAYGTQLFVDDKGMPVDYIVWLGDDALFHPDWLYELDELIQRHPKAYAWNVYRSAYEKYHRPTGNGTEYDIETVCLCGHGLTFSVEEWRKWGIDWKTGHWPSPAGDTLDLHHSWVRQSNPPGGRWCTRKSYIQHTGKVGQHCTGNEPEYAIDFQGTGE